MSGDHDALFKTVFCDPVSAEAELRSVLPPDVSADLVPGSLVLEPGSFVDEELRATHADLLFRVRFGDEDALVYVLFEHQSSEDRWMATRIARYVLDIWKREIERTPTRPSLPTVIPIVVHQGPRPLRAATDVAQLVVGPAALERFRPRWPFLIDDLGTLSDAGLLARPLPPLAALSLAALRDARTLRDAAAWLERWAELVRMLVASGDHWRALGLVVRYLSHVRRDVDLHELARRADAIALGAGEPIMSTARQLIEEGFAKGVERGREEGREQGREQGREEGRRQLLRRQLELRFGALGDEHAHRIAEATAAELDRWGDRVIVAASVDDALS